MQPVANSIIYMGVWRSYPAFLHALLVVYKLPFLSFHSFVYILSSRSHSLYWLNWSINLCSLPPDLALLLPIVIDTNFVDESALALILLKIESYYQICWTHSEAARKVAIGEGSGQTRRRAWFVRQPDIWSTEPDRDTVQNYCLYVQSHLDQLEGNVWVIKVVIVFVCLTICTHCEAELFVILSLTCLIAPYFSLVVTLCPCALAPLYCGWDHKGNHIYCWSIFRTWFWNLRAYWLSFKIYFLPIADYGWCWCIEKDTC